MHAVPVDRQSPVPLWSQVQDDLRARLARGEFDSAFPGENALVAEYEVSRNTVRQALRGLRAEGLVTAERGRAPRVRRAEIEQPVGTLDSLFASVEAAGMRPASVASPLLEADFTQRTAVFVIERTGFAAGRPLEWRQTVVRGDRFAFDARFSARGFHLDVAAAGP